jgi:hypothetical protein
MRDGRLFNKRLLIKSAPLEKGLEPPPSFQPELGNLSRELQKFTELNKISVRESWVLLP